MQRTIGLLASANTLMSNQYEPVTFDCAACKAGKPRSDAAHTYDHTCRHAVTTARKRAPKRQRAKVPTSDEPTSGLRARGMGDADEQAVEDQLESEGTGGARQIIPIERDEEIILALRPRA